MKVYQQNIFGGEDEVITAVPVIAFENKENKGRFLADGIDCADFSDENGDLGIDDIENAFVIVRKDFSKPDGTDVDNKRKEFQVYREKLKSKFGDAAFIELDFTFDFEEALKHYNPVNLTISVTQYNVIAERNEWGTIE